MNIQEKIKNVPLYKNVLTHLGEGLNEETWLDNLPLLDKSAVVKNFPANFMTPELEEALRGSKIEYNSTSGTTGERLQIIRKAGWWEEEEQRIAPYTRYWGKYLNDPNYTRAVLTTPMCSNTVCYLDNPSYENRIIGEKLYLNTAESPDRWEQQDVQRIVMELDRFRPMHMHADPVYLALLIHLINKYKVSPPKWVPKFLTLTFEFAPAMCRNLIRSFWDIPTFSLYGSTELGYLFCECEKGKMHWCEPLNKLHFIPYKDRKNVFHLAVTSLKNEYMPFLKYSTNDLLLLNPPSFASCTCQHPSPVYIDKILGRQKDVTLNKEGHSITLGEIDQRLCELEIPIFLYQIDFSCRTFITFKYMSLSSQSLSIHHEKRIKKFLEEIYGEDNPIKMAHVVSIKPALSGKFSLIKNYDG